MSKAMEFHQATHVQNQQAGGMQPRTQTTRPIVTGASVLAIKYKDGVMMISDTLGSYGSLARFKDVQRIHKVNDTTILGASGEISDFQYIQNLLEQQTIDDFNYNDGNSYGPAEIHSYLARVLYNRRCKTNPLWNQLVTAGVRADGKSFLGYVDLYGSNYEENIVTTGYGLYMAAPLLRKGWKADMTEAEATALLEESMRVLYYRDCRTINSLRRATVTKDGVTISEPYSVSTKWDYAKFVVPGGH